MITKFNILLFVRLNASIPKDTSDVFLILDFECIKDLVLEYIGFIHLLNIWTAVENCLIPISMHFLIFSRQCTDGFHLSIFHASVMRNDGDFSICLSDYNANVCILNCRQGFFLMLRRIHFYMTMEQYLDFKEHMMESNSRTN